MDLNQAFSSSDKYVIHTDIEVRDHDLNHNLLTRTFDVGPMSVYRTNTMSHNMSEPQGVQYERVACQYETMKGNEPLRDKTRSSQFGMTQQYLRMKQTQDRESLMNNPNVNQYALKQLDRTQFDETRHLAEQIKAQHANKYNCLKTLTPQPITNMSMFCQPSQVVKERNLKKDLSKRQNDILSQVTDIKSYKPQFVSTLVEAYGQ
jgi:hypothetical protein